MDSQKVDMYLMTNAKYFEGHQVPMIKKQLEEVDDSKWVNLQSLNLKDPTTSLIVSILGGQLGIDRFIIGDVGMGVGKLLTCGGLGIWAIVDWFIIMGRTREINFENFQRALLV
ncbi:TM2 domain-containing protein [Flavobacteriales bacterium]|nr:TM2 domain-containing protein [Flavobacteriales bacterium]